MFLNIFKLRKHPLGVISRDPIDIRDYQLIEIQPEEVGLPEKFNLRDKMTSIQDQHYGSCTSHSVDGVKEYLDKKEYGKEIKLSQKFIYYNTKKISELWDIEGDYLRNACKSVVKYGACLENTFPDKKRLSWRKYVSEEPSEQAYQEAERYKAKTFWSVGNTLNEVRQAIYQQKAPVAIAMRWYKSYNRPAKDGRLSLPDKVVGGHAIDIVGWEKDNLWLRNSWGKPWGADGYFYIPFDEFKKHDIWNARVILDIEAPLPKETEGWVADAWLRNEFTKGETAWTTYWLNLRTGPWNRVIKTLEPGEKVEILGEKQKTDNLTWQKVRLERSQPTNTIL